MEGSEPALFPEWLRSTGSLSGGGSSAHHFASSSRSDVLSSTLSTRNRSTRSITDKDTPRSLSADRISSSNSQLNSTSNGSSKHPYSSFGRSHRDKKRVKDRERSGIGGSWDHDTSDPWGDILISRVEKDTLRRSCSLLCGKAGEVLPRRAVALRNGGSNNHDSSNGVLSGGSSVRSLQKVAFDKDFPSLGTVEKQGVPDLGSFSSASLSTAVHSLPVGNTGLIGVDGWTSALVEVPAMAGSNCVSPLSVQQSELATPSSAASSSMLGLNMAEALSQAPSRPHISPQLTDKIQRLEELAIKQSRQLIPMTPSVPKGLVLSSDKSKPKTVVRTSENSVAVKSVQQQSNSSQLANQSLRGGQVRTEASRPFHAGKFLVLKPVRENGASSVAKGVSSSNNNVSGVANTQLATTPVTPSAPLKSHNNPKLSSIECKVAALALNSGSCVEKRLSLSQAQSRSDFFNLMRKKTSTNTTIAIPDSGVAVLSSVEKSGEVVKGADAENGSQVNCNGDIEVEKNLSHNGAFYPDEEEAAFLRSLGWEENDGEDDGLTEEEINAFYEEYMKMKPSLKLCRGVHPRLPVLSESHAIGSSRASSELSSSESEPEA